MEILGLTSISLFQRSVPLQIVPGFCYLVSCHQRKSLVMEVKIVLA